jgi:ketosteroid isomerase-like protein
MMRHADPAVVHELEALEEQLAVRWRNRDCAGWGALLADDWTVTHIAGNVISKAEALELCRTGPPIDSRADQITVRAYGDTAIVTGRTTASTTGEQPVTIQLRFTDVFVKNQGRWLVVASHATQIQNEG